MPPDEVEWPVLPALLVVIPIASVLVFIFLFRIAVAVLLLGIFLARRGAEKASKESAHTKQLKGKETVAFFHPYANAGGGGERVLWCAIRAMQRQHPSVTSVVFTGDIAASKEEILRDASRRFGVELNPELIHFIFLEGRRWVEASAWPRFTLLGQSIGSMILAYEAACQFFPPLLIDTMGYAFAMAFFRALTSSLAACYVHYPTISMDMLEQVRRRDVGVCNPSSVAKSRLLSLAKLLYYRLFALCYGFVGSQAAAVTVNSSWTRAHIDALWNIPARTFTVFPPCDTTALAALPLERQVASDSSVAWAAGGLLVLSIAQFRPEKDHPLQLRAFARFLAGAPPQYREAGNANRARLVLVGGCRDLADRERVQQLSALARELGLKEASRGEAGAHAHGAGSGADWDIRFCLDVPNAELKALLGRADVGLHTMRDEHFGISVVEMMAGGAIALAHQSGGPLADIVTQWNGKRTGFLAHDDETYAAALSEILVKMDAKGRREVAESARQAVQERFTEERFESDFVRLLVSPLLPQSTVSKKS